METDVARLGLAAAHELSESLMIVLCSLDGIEGTEPETQADLIMARTSLSAAITTTRELRSYMERFGATPSSLRLESVAKNTWFPKAAVERKDGC